MLSLVAISERELDAAEAYGRALEVFRAQDHRWGVTTVLVLTHIAMNRKSPAFTSLLEESAALLESGPDRWGRAHVLNLRGYEALNNFFWIARRTCLRQATNLPSSWRSGWTG